MAGEDFVQVKLSAAGETMAGEAKRIQMVHGRRAFDFKAGEVQRVDKSYEWAVLLRNEKYKGQPIFELVPTAAAPATASDTAKPVAVKTDTPQASAPGAQEHK